MVPAEYVHRKDSSVLGHRYTNILGSFFFFSKRDTNSRVQQLSVFLLLICFLKKESLYSMCDENLIPAINVGISTQKILSHVWIPASFNLVVVSYFKYQIMMSDI